MNNSEKWNAVSLDSSRGDRARLDALTETLRSDPNWRIHALLIEFQDHLIYEAYFSGQDETWGQPLGLVDFTPETRHDLRSVTKSVVSALVGIAVASGAITSLDTPVVDYFPEYPDLQTPQRRQITLRHALTMTAGLDWNEDLPYTDPRNDEIAMTFSSEPFRHILSRPIIAAPGAVWRYNGGLSQLLAAIVSRTTGMPLLAYAESVLFGPLGIANIEWMGDIAGMPSGASGLRLCLRDLAKFASLYLHQGRWNEQQIVPLDWVAESTRRQFPFADSTDRGYGYQWWYNRFAAPTGDRIEVPGAIGNGEQRIFLLPALNAAVTVLAGRYNDFSSNPTEQLLREYIIPALMA